MPVQTVPSIPNPCALGKAILLLGRGLEPFLNEAAGFGGKVEGKREEPERMPPADAFSTMLRIPPRNRYHIPILPRNCLVPKVPIHIVSTVDATLSRLGIDAEQPRTHTPARTP